MSAQERADVAAIRKALRRARRHFSFRHIVAEFDAADVALDALAAELASFEQALADAQATDWNGLRRKAEEQVARLEQERRELKLWNARVVADLAAARAREQRLREALARLLEATHLYNVADLDDDAPAVVAARAALAAEPAADDKIDRPNEWTASNVPKFEYRESGSASAAADELKELPRWG